MTAPSKFRAARLGGASLLTCLVAAGCQNSNPDRAVLDAWLTCIECTDGELDSLKAQATFHASTIDTLREDLLHGPSATRRARLAQQLTATYQLLAAYVASHPNLDSLAFTQAQFVDLDLENMVTIYQGRAARGLGEIGGTHARAALDSALQLPQASFPPSVWAEIHYARDSLIGP
jgi:hypothetical protein